MKLIAYTNNVNSLRQVIYEAEHYIKRLNREVTLYLVGREYSIDHLPQIEGLTYILKSIQELDKLLNSCDRVYLDDFVHDNRYSDYMRMIQMIQLSTVPTTLLNTSFNDTKAIQYREDTSFYYYDADEGKCMASDFDEFLDVLKESTTSSITRVYAVTQDNSFQVGESSSLFSSILNTPKLANHIQTRYVIQHDNEETLTWELSAKGVVEFAQREGLVSKDGTEISSNVTIYSIVEELPIATIHKHIIDKRVNKRYIK